MREQRVAAELLKLAKDLIAGDEWSDKGTQEFVKELANVMKSDRVVGGVKAKGNRVEFNYVPGLFVVVPLVMEVMEFGYDGESESLNGMVFSEKDKRFRVPGGYTRDRNPKELWQQAKKNLIDIMRRALG